METLQHATRAACDAVNSASRLQLATAAACALPVVVVTFGSVRRWLRDRRLPPGPSGLPLLGCVRLNDQSRWHLELEELGKEYNGLFSFYFGTQLFVVVSSFELMKEMLDSPSFSGRHRTPMTKKLFDNAGIALAEGRDWSFHRRLSLRILRDFGFAKEASFQMLLTAMESVFASIDESIERQTPTSKMLQHFLDVTNSVIAQLLFGRLFTRADPAFREFCDSVAFMFEHPFFSALDKYPALYSVVVHLATPADRHLSRMRDFVRTVIRERRQVVEADEFAEPACLCDVYIQEKRKAEEKGDFQTFRDVQIEGVCSDFFVAGTDTTARSVEWMVLMMAFHPEVQAKVHRELDEVVGRAGRLQLAHRSQLQYTSAVIEECYRRAPIGANGFAHRATEDTEFRGFLIPKDTLVLPQMYSVLRSDQLWEQPEQFRPERFLDSSGRFKSSPYVIPFLVGRRSCVGEALARMEIFGMFASIFQRFEVRPTVESLGRRDEILTPILRLALEPGEYELLFSRR